MNEKSETWKEIINSKYWDRRELSKYSKKPL